MTTWVDVCRIRDLTADRGVAAFVAGDEIAVFRLADAPGLPGTLHAVDHRDPNTGVGVLARGLVGSVDGRAFVTCPLHKHRFDLVTGRGLDDDRFGLRVWPVRVHAGTVQVGTVARAADRITNTST